MSDLLDALALIAGFAVLATALRMTHRRFDRGGLPGTAPPRNTAGPALHPPDDDG
ncbi:hypothetical protein Amsp01_087610 [Amycolatopsis sp. NBRC 101858]|nr:hypothetical protein Amsp01_087610 [Amycolatopsis sp. NBRC 101858]